MAKLYCKVAGLENEMKIWLDGKLVGRHDAKLSVFDHATLYGDGVFEGLRVYGGDVFQAQAHLDRLAYSAQQIRLELPYSLAQLAEAMDECVRVNEISQGYIRLVVTRGVGLLGLNPFNCSKASVFIVADQIELYPEEMYANGMPVIIAKTVRTSPRMLNPKVKSLNYLNSTLAKIEAIDAGVLEALMTNEHGNLAEGTGDNIFIVRDGAVITPPAEAGILLGITRGVVMHLARKMELGVLEENFTPAELLAADECFLTGTAAEIIAVIKVGQKPLGEGQPGPITKKLQAAFGQFVATGEQVPYNV